MRAQPRSSLSTSRGKALRWLPAPPQTLRALCPARQGEINVYTRTVARCRRVIKSELHSCQCGEGEKKLIYKQYYDNLLPAGGGVGSTMHYQSHQRKFRERERGGSAIKQPELE